jgi:hypothetical protein
MPAFSGSLAAADSLQLPSTNHPVETPPLVLEITRGRTRFRSRPVTGPRFLIGGGVTCNLRMGGADIPVLHSIITISNGEVHLEAIAPAPVLIVNGRGVREVELFDGDVIAIGDVELRARLVAWHPPAAIQAADTQLAYGDEGESPLAELSALELIDRIEAEERLIDEFEERRLTGARALVENVFSRVDRSRGIRRHQATRPRVVPAPHFLSKRPQVLAGRSRSVEAALPLDADDSQLLDGFDELGRQLTELSQELQTSAARSTLRESHYAEATELLMQTQDKLATQLETLASQVAANQQPSSSKPRAIA